VLYVQDCSSPCPSSVSIFSSIYSITPLLYGALHGALLALRRPSRMRGDLGVVLAGDGDANYSTTEMLTTEILIDYISCTTTCASSWRATRRPSGPGSSCAGPGKRACSDGPPGSRHSSRYLPPATLVPPATLAATSNDTEH
jgi:hypothetical protein